MARFATVHWIRFPRVMTPDQLALTEQPRDCVSFKIGPDGPVGANGYREPSNTWCAVALFDDAPAAEAALAAHERFLPSLASADESWHALLLPVTTS